MSLSHKFELIGARQVAAFRHSTQPEKISMKATHSLQKVVHGRKYQDILAASLSIWSFAMVLAQELSEGSSLSFEQPPS